MIDNPVYKKALKHIFKHITMFIGISVLVLISINFGAYYEIIKYKINNYYHPEMYEPISNTGFVGDRIDLSFLSNDMKVVLDDLSRHIPTPDDSRIIIPKINKNVPLVFVQTQVSGKEWQEVEGVLMDALKRGVVHYPDSAMPGEVGNFVVTGHSSYYPWDNGRYKSVFALLEEVEVGDEIIYYHKQKKFVYKIKSKEVVLPDQVNVLNGSNTKETTIITCVPVGTNLKRLVLKGELVGK